MPNRSSKLLFGGFMAVYVVLWIFILVHLISIRRSFYPLGNYGSKIEGNHYYLKTDKNHEEYKEVTRQQYEGVDKSSTNAGIALFGGGFGLLMFGYLGIKLRFVEGEIINDPFGKW